MLRKTREETALPAHFWAKGKEESAERRERGEQGKGGMLSEEEGEFNLMSTLQKARR